MNRVIIITGPTASGKTVAAITVARKFNTEIISADSRQCYRELRIGVARPTNEELKAVPHHFIASHSLDENITAAFFEKFALDKCKELFTTRNVVVMVGGTGLYIKAFCEGLDEIPTVDPGIRESIRQLYNEKGLSWLQEELSRKDPVFYSQGEIKNPQRSMRALEVVEGTGMSILSFHQGNKAQRPFVIEKYGINPGKDMLHHNIDQRVDQMIRSGLVDEVRSVERYRDKPALRTVGYSEIFEYLDGHTSLEEAIKLIKIHTRQYAKRQLTWFRKDSEINWVKAEELTPKFE